MVIITFMLPFTFREKEYEENFQLMKESAKNGGM